MRSMLTYSEHSKKKEPDSWSKYLQSRLHCRKFLHENSKHLSGRKQKIELFFDQSKIRFRKSVEAKKNLEANSYTVVNKYGAWM